MFLNRNLAHQLLTNVALQGCPPIYLGQLLRGKVEVINELIANIRKALAHVKNIAEQLPKVDRWATLLR
jgi:hypothetical protein